VKRAILLPALCLLLSACGAGFYLHHGKYLLAGAKPAVNCGEGPGFKYCLHEGPHGDGRDALYFLHYANGSELSWSKIPLARAYYAEFHKRGLPAPRVVSVSYGTHWNLLDKGGRLPGGGLFDHFVSTAMPFLEARLGKPGRRFIWGMSQGSLNGALLVLKRPELWSGAVFSCPAWFTIPVHADDKTVAEFVARTRADPKVARSGLDFIRERTAGPEEWAREEPLARAAAASRLPPLSVDCTTGDEYGFFEGARRFSEILKARGEPVTFRAERGSHCQLDARAASAFLADISARPLDKRAPTR
jgi:pimeloyl-ACP methyl ester carboxylesterase